MTVNSLAAAHPEPRSPTSVLSGIFFLSIGMLIFQISLTRLFAITMFHHFGYLIVSLALLGIGASGTFLAISRIAEKSDEEINKYLSIGSLLTGVTMILSFMISSRMTTDSLQIWRHARDMISLAVTLVIMSVPFFTGGMVIGICLSRYARQVGTLYFSDLVGAGLGAVFSPILLSNFGLTGTMVSAACFALLGSLMYSLKSPRSYRIVNAVVLAVSLILFIGFSGGALIIPAMHWNIRFAPHKLTSLFPNGRSETVIYSPVAQVDVSERLQAKMAMGGEFGKINRQEVQLKIVTQDGEAPTFLIQNASNLERFPSLDDAQAGSSYLTYKTTGRSHPDVMVIGVGGGIDIMMARSNNARSITAVEINRGMIDLVTKRYTKFIGNLFDNPKISLIHEDGRSHLR